MIAAQERETVASDLGLFTHDPLKAVLYGFPWGEGELESAPGPREWQKRILQDIGEHLSNPETRHTPFKCAVASGHGIGKSALVSMIIWWALSTFEDTKIVVTANTKGQLETKTQPEASKWFRLAVNSSWFDVNVASIKVDEVGHERTWRADFNPWSEENSSAFAGAHNQGKRLVVIMDEASEIASVISAEVGRGAMTDADTELLWFKFGNPTLNSGDFYECTHGNQRHRWKRYIIDSRTIEGINKAEIAEWEQDYGEDSDFFRVRVRGLPPRAASGQYIDQERIQSAQTREARSLADDPLVAGVDFAWGGKDDNVVRFRKGLDARSIPPIKVKGLVTRDPAVMVGKLADVLNNTYNGEQVATLFFDSAGIAAPVEARLRAMGHKNILVVNFGAESPSPKAAYFRDFMWMEMHDWLEQGAIDKDPGLAADLSKPLLVSDKDGRIKLESKEIMHKRLAKLGIESTSPDDGDALALTFAHKVLPNTPATPEPRGEYGSDSWMA